MSRKCHLQKVQRICALWIAVGYCCLTVIVPFHQHRHPGEASVPVSVSGHSGISSTPAVVHCAACEWEAIVGSLATHGVVFVPPTAIITSVVPSPPRALRSLAFATSSRGPPCT